MSAVRRSERRANRNSLASPYARPAKQQVKKSLWSLSGLINFLNPFGGTDALEDAETPSDYTGEIEQGSPPRPFSPPQQILPPPPLPPPPQSSSNLSWPSATNGPSTGSAHVVQPSQDQTFSLNPPSYASSGPSLAKNLEPVTRFLVEKAGQPLNEFEAAGIVDYIQKNVQGSTLVPDKPEPFRFSVSPSRGATPTMQGTSSTQTPRKTLSRNPNGVYRWQGAGSSRPRNRYQSPGFAPRPQQHRIKLSPPKTPPTTDTKRRRVGDDAEFMTPQNLAVPSTTAPGFLSPVLESPIRPLHHATEPSAASVNDKPTGLSVPAPAPPVTPKPNGIQPRIRTGGLATKPTVPAIPSPLRQTWKESDSPPQVSPPCRPTRAADFMTELIKEVTPTKKPDISNPYQSASPVKPPAPVRKPMVRRSRPSVKPVEKPKEPEPEVSAQTIIEATIPKGTKRARPPPEIEKAARVGEFLNGVTDAPMLNGAAHISHSGLHVEETATAAKEEESPSKRRKTPPVKPSLAAQEVEEVGPPRAVVRPAEIIEPAEVPIHINGRPTSSPPATTPSPPSATKPLGVSKTCTPKEPSKLRYSFQADKVEVVKSAETTPPRSASIFTPPPIQLPTVPKATAAPAKAKLSPKEEVLAMDVDELPKYMFSAGMSSSLAGPSYTATRTAVLSLSVTALPVYELTPIVAPVHTMNGFNWTAAGLKAPTASAQTWECSLCCLQNPSSAKEKCTICDAPRQGAAGSSQPVPILPSPPTPAVAAAPAAPIVAFDWAAAGVAPPIKLEQGTWTCSVCALTNPASVVDKCTVCDSPR